MHYHVSKKHFPLLINSMAFHLANYALNVCHSLDMKKLFRAIFQDLKQPNRTRRKRHRTELFPKTTRRHAPVARGKLPARA